MKKASLAITAFAMVLSGCAAGAADKPETSSKPHGKGMMMGMSMMDTNKDGLITKDEFMKGHEMMFDHMKNKDGVIDAKSMENGCSGMMGEMKGGMMGADKMKGHHMMENSPMMDGQMGQGNK